MSIYTTRYENVANLRATMAQATTANELIDLYEANMVMIHDEHILNEYTKRLMQVQNNPPTTPEITGFYSGYREILRMARTYLTRKLKLATSPIPLRPKTPILHNGMVMEPVSIESSGIINCIRTTNGEEMTVYADQLEIGNYFAIVDLVGEEEMGVVNADTVTQ